MAVTKDEIVEAQEMPALELSDELEDALLLPKLQRRRPTLTLFSRAGDNKIGVIKVNCANLGLKEAKENVEGVRLSSRALRRRTLGAQLEEAGATVTLK